MEDLIGKKVAYERDGKRYEGVVTGVNWQYQNVIITGGWLPTCRIIKGMNEIEAL